VRPKIFTVSATSEDDPMQNYALTWTDPDGRPRASAVAYDKTSADERRGELEDAGCTDIEIVEVKPGELPQPRA
jgi:hypothetical protein